MNRTLEDINQNEINPALYLKRAREIRSRRIEETLGGIIISALIVAVFVTAQVAYGIW